MSHADDEITQRIDELSGDFDDRLMVIEGAGGRFWTSIGEERVEVGVDADEGEGASKDGNSRKEISLSQAMTDLEMLMDEKRARLKVLVAEYTRVRAELVKLAIAILGEEGVSLLESEFDKQDLSTAKQPGKSMPSPSKNILNAIADVDADTTTIEHPTSPLSQIYDTADSGLTDLQTTLDELATRNLDENRNTLKVRQIELRCLFLALHMSHCVRLREARGSRERERETVCVLTD